MTANGDLKREEAQRIDKMHLTSATSASKIIGEKWEKKTLLQRYCDLQGEIA